MIKYLIFALVVALLCCSMGFGHFIWFLSIGYGLAVAGIGVFTIIYGGINGLLTPALSVALVVISAYGLRLAYFIFKRETKSSNYKKVLQDKVGSEPPIFVKIAVWLMVGVLYVCQTAGLHLRMMNETQDDVALYIGIVITLIGFITEAVADKQKNAQKTARPDMVATKGLFKLCRCPNYFGEILVWTGVFVAGLTTYTGVWQWVMILFGYISIVYIMLDGAKRLEKGQVGRYGNNEEYLAYANKTPIIFPFIPIYHLYREKKDK